MCLPRAVAIEAINWSEQLNGNLMAGAYVWTSLWGESPKATVLGGPHILWVLPPATPPGSHDEEPRKILSTLYQE